MFPNHVIFKKLPEENNGPIGESSPNLVTLYEKHDSSYIQIQSIDYV
jgi:hypothetical protein